MFNIIAQYRRLFSSLICNSFSEKFDFNANEFNSLSENARQQFLKNNSEQIINFMNWLDNNKDKKVSYYANGWWDFFSLEKEIALKNILKSIWLDSYNLNDWIDLSLVIDKMKAFTSEKTHIISESRTHTEKLKTEIKSNNEVKSNISEANSEANEKQFLDNITASIVKPEKWELYGYVEDETFKLEINNYVFIWNDPVYTFNHVPTSKEIVKVVTNFNKATNFTGWENIPDEKFDNGNLKSKTTKEDLNVPTHKILWVETTIDKNEYRDNKELVNLLRNKNNEQLKTLFKQIYNALDKAWVIDQKTGTPYLVDTWVYRNFTITGEDDINTVLEQAWYNTTRLSGKELGIIYDTLANKIKTQDKIAVSIKNPKSNEKQTDKMSDNEIVSLLFDENGDGEIDTKIRSDFSEAQASFVTLDSLLSDGIDTFAKNVWYTDKKSLLLSMSRNLSATRENVQRELHANIERNGSLEWMVVKWQRVKETKKLIEETNSLEQKKKFILTWFITKKFGVSKLEQLSNEQRTLAEKIIDTMTPQSIWLWVADNKFWGWVSFDLQDATSLEGIPWLEKLWNLFDTLSIWLSEKWAGVALSRWLFKDFLSEYWVSLTLSWVNLVIWSLSGSVRLNTATLDEVERLFQEEANSKVEFSLVWWITTGLIYTGWIQADIVNENTPIWKEKMANQLWTNLELALVDILDWKASTNSSITTQDKQAYKQLRNVFNVSTEGLSIEEKRAFAPKFIEWYVANFKNKLNQNSAWLNITSVWIWVLMIPGFMPIPYITAGGEISWQEYKVLKWETVKKDAIDISRIGWKPDTINGQKVLSFPADKINTLSVANWSNVQMEEKNWKIYVSGVAQSDIKLKQNISNNNVENTLIIWWWVTDETGDYVDTWIVNNPITTSLEIGKKADTNTELWVDIQSDLQNTNSIRLDLNQIISYDALKNPNTIWMMKLQRNIFENRTTWKPDISEVWNQYLKVISYKWFAKYAKKDVSALISDSQNITKDSEKILIFQTVSNNLMEKWWLKQQKDTSYAIDKWQTISEYNKTRNRNKFFDKLITEQLPDISWKITEARNKWYQINWDAKTYNSLLVTDSIWFSGTQSKKWKEINIRWLTPYVGAFNVAWNSLDTAFVEIPWKSADLVNHIPNNVLESYRATLNNYWTDLNNASEVKTFINNWWNENIKLDYTMLFCKNAECLNDCVSLKLNINVKWKNILLNIWWEQESTKNATINKSINIWVAAAPKFEKKEVKTKPTPTPPTTTPWNGWWTENPPITPPSTTPWNGWWTENQRTVIVTKPTQSIPTWWVSWGR